MNIVRLIFWRLDVFILQGLKLHKLSAAFHTVCKESAVPLAPSPWLQLSGAGGFDTG